MRLKLGFLFGFAVCLQSAPSLALPPLHDDPVVREGFYNIGIADEVRRNCPDISPRLVRAYAYLKQLEKHARDSGYTEADFQQVENDMPGKEDMRAQIQSELSRRGASPGDARGYCAVGRQEIARGTPVGQLLQEN